MSNLLRKPFGTHGKVHDITLESAGWRYVGFGLYRLRAGETVAEATGDREVILVMIEGKAQITGAGQGLGRFRRPHECVRENPAALPLLAKRQRLAGHRHDRLHDRRLRSTRKSRAPSPPHRPRRDHAHRTRQRHQHPLHQQHRDGERGLLRQPSRDRGFHPRRPLVILPSHRHDEDDFPRITYLEETYYHRLNPASGFGIQRVYTDDGGLDETMAVSDGDVVLVPRGHHPCGAPYGFEMYYLNVMAGPLRKWRFVAAPEVDWIMERDA